MTVILVTDGLERAALAACRSLVAAGYHVHAAAPRRRSLAGVSRGVREHVLAADQVSQPSAFAREIGALAEKIDARLLLPITDPSVSALLASPEHVPAGCTIPFPSHEAFGRASDKVGLLPLAQAAGFGIPESTLLATPRDVERADLEALRPGVVKPHRSLVSVGDVQVRLNVERFETAEEGRRLLANLPEGAFPVLAQKRIEGPGVGFFALRWGGEVRAMFAHRRLREKPPTGGVSVYRESIAMDPALAEAGTKLLDALAWEGVAMVECKRESATGRYYVMEINARLWGSLQLAIDAGVDFPRLLVECALGRCPSAAPDYRVGVRSRWLWGELDHIYLRTKHPQPGRSAIGSFLGACTEFARLRPMRDRCEVLRLSDPGPFLVETFRRFGVLR